MSRPIADLDGNVLPPPPAGSDLEQLLHLLMFCRRNDLQLISGVRIGSITIGGVRDLRQKTGPDGAPELDFWEAAGHRDNGDGG